MGRKRAPVLRLVACAAVLLAAASGAAVYLVDAAPGWMVPALGSDLALRCIVIVGAGAAVLAGLVILAVRRSGRDGRRSALGIFGDNNATAAFSTVLVFPVALVVLLVIVQGLLLFNANMVVHYAAYSAARVAVVTVPLDIGEEDRNRVKNPDLFGKEASTKLELIRRAAVLALVSISDDTGGGSGGGDVVEAQTKRLFQRGDEEPWWLNRVAKQYNYANANTVIDLAKPHHWRDGNAHNDCPYHHWDKNWTSGGWSWYRYCPYFEEDWDFWYWETLAVRLKYDFALTVPVAGAVFADEIDEADVEDGDEGEAESPGAGVGPEHKTLIKAVVTLPNEGRPHRRAGDLPDDID